MIAGFLIIFGMALSLCGLVKIILAPDDPTILPILCAGITIQIFGGIIHIISERNRVQAEKYWKEENYR